MKNSQFGTQEELKKKMGDKKIFSKGDCPFCHDIKEHQRILWKGKHWAVILNMYPYILSGKHIMLIPIRHVCFSHNISKIEYGELPIAYTFIEKFYENEEYFSFTRESFAERSVEHLHSHFLPGDLTRKSITDMLIGQGYEKNI